MAIEREISTNMDLTIDEAVKEWSELNDYLRSEDWVYSVVEKVQRRQADLAFLVMKQLAYGTDS
jgi:hypothetical protein